MSDMDTPLDHTQEEAMPLVEWALTPMGHCNPEEDYANVLASTNHLEILCFITGPPLAWLPKPTKSCSDFLYKAERSMFLGPNGAEQGFLAARRGRKRGRRYDLGSERSGKHLRYITQSWFQTFEN